MLSTAHMPMAARDLPTPLLHDRVGSPPAQLLHLARSKMPVAGVRNACGPWFTPLWPLPWARLDRQESLRPLAGEVPVEGIDAEGQHAVVPHEHGQFCQPLYAELLLRGLEGPTADPVGPEELLTVSYHRLFSGVQRRQGPLLAQGVHQLGAQTGLLPSGRMGIPDVLAVQRTRCDQHSEFLDVGGQGGLTAQIGGEVCGPTTRLRAVDHNGAWAGAGHTAAALHDRIKGLLVVVWNTLACGSRNPRHLAAPSLIHAP